MADDLLELLEEQKRGPLPCPHVGGVYMKTGGWVLQANPRRPYYGEWVHNDPRCRRSSHPGQHVQLELPATRAG